MVEISIQPFAEWMNPQVIKMFGDFYRKEESKVLEEQHKFYLHKFQADRAIRIVAVEKEKVIGFCSFAYWPYKKGDKLFRSYQVGNAMIHPDYRGKGIFPRLLKYLDTHHKELGVDILLAFPHDTASYPSFMKFGYVNPIDLVWGVKLLNPFACIKNADHILSKFSRSPAIICEDTKHIKLYRTEAFDHWFFSSRIVNNYAYFNFQEKENMLTLYLKSNRRGKWINELIIGDIISNSGDTAFFRRGLKRFFAIARNSKSVTLISIAYNPKLNSQTNAIIQKEFRKIKPVIHFVYKTYIDDIDILVPDAWELYRGDLDTW